MKTMPTLVEVFDLPFVQLVNDQGKFTKEVEGLEGVFVKDGDKEILKRLEESGKLFAAIPFEHSYPFCWRCDTPLLYYARDTWFISMTKVRDQLLKNNATVNWMPDNIKNGVSVTSLKMLLTGVFQEKDIGVLHFLFGNVNVVTERLLVLLNS